MLSKFGGTKPLLYGDHQWPRCGMCNRNMMFVMQIDERSLDSEMRNVIAPGDAEAKMFQFFLCYCLGEPRDPFYEVVLLHFAACLL